MAKLPAPTDLGPIIAAVDCLRAELGMGRWAELIPYCDDGDPRTCDGPALERLHERLIILWAEGGNHG